MPNVLIVVRIIALFLLFLVCQDLVAQLNVRGKVIGADDGLPLPHVKLIVKETAIETFTNVNGEFSLTVPKRDVKISLLFLGYRVKKVNPVFGQPMLIELSPDCTHHHYHSTGFKLYGGVDMSNNAYAGRVEFPVLRFNKSITSNYEFSGLGGQETHRIDLKVWDLYQNCKFDLNTSLNYRNYDISRTGLDFESLVIAPAIGLDNYELVLGVGTGKRKILDQSSTSTGLQLGINTDINLRLWNWLKIPIQLRATKWDTFWDFESSIDFFIRPVGLRLSYNRINDFNQFSMSVGVGIASRSNL